MNFMQKVANFTLTYADWVAKGRPRRDPSWVHELFGICKKCDRYDPKKIAPFGQLGVCRECGCHVGDNSDTTNKLVIPTTECPLGLWKAAVEPADRKPSFIQKLRNKGKKK